MIAPLTVIKMGKIAPVHSVKALRRVGVGDV
jgi:hypothetical protein